MLKDKGFTKVGTFLEPDLIINYQGQQKCGKTHQMLSAPGPIAVFSLNIGTKGVIHKFAGNKDIYLKQYQIPIGFKKISQTISRKTADIKERNPLDLNIDKAIEIWEDFKSDYYAALADNDIKSIGIDTGTDLYALQRCARFGKLDQVDSHLYGPVYLEFAHIIRAAFNYNKNVIILHELKDEYKKYENAMGKSVEMKTGKMILDGCRKIPNLVQLNCNCFKRGNDFVVKVLDSRHNPDMIGFELFNEDANFENLKELILG